MLLDESWKVVVVMIVMTYRGVVFTAFPGTPTCRWNRTFRLFRQYENELIYCSTAYLDQIL